MISHHTVVRVLEDVTGPSAEHQPQSVPNGEDDLAELPVELQVPMSLDDVIEVKRPVDQRESVPDRRPTLMKCLARSSRSGWSMVDEDEVQRFARA